MENEKMRYLTEKEVSELTRLALSTLRNARQSRRLIPWVKIGRAIRYRLSDVLDFMESHKIETQQEE